ncbi:MAG: 3'-5' exonuclease [Planctomycetales bacterium]|nr:3'-5' exonuclease [Planctomycetales bacterium]
MNQVSNDEVEYFVFDVESVADGQLVADVRFPGQDLDPACAIEQYRGELLDKTGSDFIPYTHQLPVSVVIAKVTGDLRIADIVELDAPEYRSHVITELFWRGWEHYKQPTLVTFNGRSFDVPLLELAAFRYGISVPGWFAMNAKSYDQPRNRYNTAAHWDLQDLMVNFGATRFNGGLNLAATVLGKPGKIDVQGDMVQDLYNAGKLAEINDYCRCDVLDTYFVFLRACVLIGRIDRDAEKEIVESTKAWLEDRADTSQAYRTYLSAWGDWKNPWANE